MTIAYSLAASSANKPGHVSRRRKKKSICTLWALPQGQWLQRLRHRNTHAVSQRLWSTQRVHVPGWQVPDGVAASGHQEPLPGRSSPPPIKTKWVTGRMRCKTSSSPLFFFCLPELTRNFTVQIRDYSYCLYDPHPKKISISRTKVMNKVGKCLSNTWWRDDEGQRLKGCKRTGKRRKRLGEKGGQRREWF